jgi:mutual gliding-motility protein MglA
MFINWKQREINLNIIYFGTAYSGKTTNLERIHASLNPAFRNQLFTLNTHEDRTIYFDFMQVNLGQIQGLTPRFGLYTVPGQVYYEATREIVLRKADGVVFVVDSAPDRQADNLRAWQDMVRMLARRMVQVERFPVVVQMNKRDLPGVETEDWLKTSLGVERYVCVPASASRNEGVKETLFEIMKLVLTDVRTKLAAARSAGLQNGMSPNGGEGQACL